MKIFARNVTELKRRMSTLVGAEYTVIRTHSKRDGVWKRRLMEVRPTLFMAMDLEDPTLYRVRMQFPKAAEYQPTMTGFCVNLENMKLEFVFASCEGTTADTR